MEYERLITTVVSGLIGIIIGHFFTLKRERRGRVYKNKEKVLKEVYAPIYKILSPDFGYSSEYKGTVKIKQIEEIVHNNSELVDTQLIQMVKDTRAGIRMVDGPTGEKDDFTVVYDHDKKFFTYIRDQYNSLKKELGLPYDKKVK
ncbi:hypothetical protein F8158_22875 [Bacillus cereus]|uniref:Uncharacterized protein n=1 Tax=Bacillus cereus TaxID=1396 RepID=A0AB34D1I0_BACCE|nr:hypothetical protein [Bacillus cereus]KAB2493212.1 hypothetical protein F8158_22875 [Bacillus cereus]